jgi:cobalt-zinc-cadmium efflux system membrane fusion protein
VIGHAELQRREVELSVARAELRAATDQLRLIGLTNPLIERLRETGALASEVAITANRTGIVVERKVSQGQVAQPGDPLFCEDGWDGEQQIYRPIRDIKNVEYLVIHHGEN